MNSNNIKNIDIQNIEVEKKPPTNIKRNLSSIGVFLLTAIPLPVFSYQFMAQMGMGIWVLILIMSILAATVLTSAQYSNQDNKNFSEIYDKFKNM